MSSADTIFALATAPGKSGVAIIRVSGSQSLTVLKCISRKTEFLPRYATYTTFYNPQTKEVIDRGLAFYFPAPHSFTGEAIAELHVHGSLAVMNELMHVLASLPDMRMAEAGEFTRRAFMHGKMDLVEAEGLADLIAAQTQSQKSQALRQMEGELSGFYNHLRHGIITSLAHLEAYIDFPDEDIPEEVLRQLNASLKSLCEDITLSLGDQQRGQMIRDGIFIVILGAPNSGKSSLLNTLAKRDAAIVSPIAGTTRDAIEIHMDICGYQVILSDTAGIRQSQDSIEQEGIKRALARAAEADLKLILFDGSQLPLMNEECMCLIDSKSLVVITKSDIMPSRTLPLSIKQEALIISTNTNEGIDDLLARLEITIKGFFSSYTHTFITRKRHRFLLEQALHCLENALLQPELELKCEELRRSGLAIGKITGKIQIDDILDVIFKDFCIGK